MLNIKQEKPTIEADGRTASAGVSVTIPVCG